MGGGLTTARVWRVEQNAGNAATPLWGCHKGAGRQWDRGIQTLSPGRTMDMASGMQVRWHPGRGAGRAVGRKRGWRLPMGRIRIVFFAVFLRYLQRLLRDSGAASRHTACPTFQRKIGVRKNSAAAHTTGPSKHRPRALHATDPCHTGPPTVRKRGRGGERAVFPLSRRWGVPA